jgi:hypothetical protein
LAGRVKFVLTGARFGHKSGGVDITGQI